MKGEQERKRKKRCKRRDRKNKWKEGRRKVRMAEEIENERETAEE